MKLAVDIALLPPDDIMDFAIQLNRPLVQGIEDEIVLDKTKCLPHITLAMGVMEEAQIKEVKDRMEKIAARFFPLDLKIASLEVTARPDGKSMSGLVVERSSELQRLHIMVMDEIVPLFTYEWVTKEMFYSPPTVNEVPLWWVLNYVRSKVRDTYSPHLTLGMGKAESIALPMLFKASRIAICHLGNYCTCRKIFAVVDISERR